MSDEVRIEVREIDEQFLSENPFARTVLAVAAKINCAATFREQADRVRYFANRCDERGFKRGEMMVVLLNMNDSLGSTLGHLLMPGFDWDAIRARGEVPFAWGLVPRDALQEVLDAGMDLAAGIRLRAMSSELITTLVMDYGGVEVFEGEPSSSDDRDEG
jgi:hypothetical protein